MSDTMSIVFQGLIAPVQLAIITGLLWREVGPFSLIPLGVFILSLPFTFVLDAYYGTIVENTKASTDARLKLVREFISAIRIVKYYAWERAFQRNITEYREREVERFKKTAFLRISFVSVFGAVPPLATGSWI
jgi:ABC-type bacteriocin/lantibiotic exporter with double-glycine peptidase domain